MLAKWKSLAVVTSLASYGCGGMHGTPNPLEGERPHPSLTVEGPPAGYKLVFNGTFDRYLSQILSPGMGWGPMTGTAKWIEHTPFSGDFGSAYFTGPTEPNGDGPGKVPPNPFLSHDGELRITAYYDTVINHWRSGMISSVDTSGRGFSLALGYWEASIYMPSGHGVWPGFWLASVSGIPKNRIVNSAEIDIVEAYGVDMTQLHNNLHVWSPAGKDIGGGGKQSTVKNMSNSWHTYGCLINKDYIHYYYDGAETFRIGTPPEATLPLYVMVDFALGGGWPINISSPSYLRVGYVRAYAPAP
jgi:beta-glucanase (GH16 family)